jgi:hypothetical protein
MSSLLIHLPSAAVVMNLLRQTHQASVLNVEMVNANGPSLLIGIDTEHLLPPIGIGIAIEHLLHLVVVATAKSRLLRKGADTVNDHHQLKVVVAKGILILPLDVDNITTSPSHVTGSHPSTQIVQ